MELKSEEKVLGGLSHILCLFSWIGLVANLVIFFIYKEKSAYVGRHAKQALGLQLISLVLGLVVGGASVASVFGAMAGGHMGAAVGMGLTLALIGAALGITVLVLVIIGAVKGFTGQEYLHPVFGRAVDNIKI